MNPLHKHAGLDDVQLDGMIAYAHRQFPYLVSSSPEGLRFLCRLMIDNNFLFANKPTPIRSSFEFLRKISQTDVQNQKLNDTSVDERDFVFAIKMFGLAVRDKNDVKQFVPDNRISDAEDEEVTIESAKDSKQLEFYVSDVHKRTKIQTHTIQSATNRLLREWREIELARLFAQKHNQEGMTIGQAREYLRVNCGVKDHEFVRVRQHAINIGVFQSRRSSSAANKRVTLDEDNVEFVERLAKKFSQGRNPLTMSQATNRALRDLKVMIDPSKQNSTGKP